MDENVLRCYDKDDKDKKEAQNVADALVKAASNMLDQFGVPETAMLTATLLIFSWMFGPLRRFSRSFFCNILMFVSYTASPSLVNILGKTIPYWAYLLTAMYLLILYAGQDNINALSLQDNENYKRFTFEFIVMNLFFLSLSVQVRKYYWPVILVWISLLLKLQERKRAFFHGSTSGVAQVSHVIADYMMYEHIDQETKQMNSFDPITLKGYKYLLEEMTNKSYYISPSCQMEVRLENDITIDKIWHCPGQLLKSHDRNGLLKDLCLSFSLFMLLLRRFAGYNLYEITIPEARQKAWLLVRNGMLDKLEEEQVERVFRVIEVELMFIYDYFYTKYYVVFSGQVLGLFLKRCFIVSSIIFGSIFARFSAAIYYMTYSEYLRGVEFMKYVMFVVMGVTIVVELLQLIILLTSRWFIVKGICCYVQNHMWETKLGRFFGKMIKVLSHIPTTKPWRRKLGQYSLLQNYGYDPTIYRFSRRSVKNLMDVPRPGQRESANTKLSVDVKVALLSSLRNYGPTLSNGLASLRNNQAPMEFLSWACELETRAHVVLVWHIATSFCEMKLDTSCKKNPQDPIYKNFKIAKDLSMYCAYLVAFAPELLPDHEHITKAVFDRVIAEAKEFFDQTGCCDSITTKETKIIEKIEQVRNEEPSLKKSNIERGAILGIHLMDKIGENEKRWKILAEFWAELLLFLTPSNKHMGHAEYLVKGGELITILWALLSHAGIIESDHSPSIIITRNVDVVSKSETAMQV